MPSVLRKERKKWEEKKWAQEVCHSAERMADFDFIIPTLQVASLFSLLPQLHAISFMEKQTDRGNSPFCCLPQPIVVLTLYLNLPLSARFDLFCRGECFNIRLSFFWENK
jgi:hypothetical protein